jgi:hypothetical protein
VHERFALLGTGTGGGWIFQQFVDRRILTRFLRQSTIDFHQDPLHILRRRSVE